MLVQIALGAGLLLLNILVMAVAALALESAFRAAHPWLVAPPQRPKLLLMLVGVSFWVLVVLTIGVWTWALALHQVGAFSTLEEAVYFALVAFSTLGLGDLIPLRDWPSWPPLPRSTVFSALGCSPRFRSRPCARSVWRSWNVDIRTAKACPYGLIFFAQRTRSRRHLSRKIYQMHAKVVSCVVNISCVSDLH